ncbi:MAG: hypothetical protein AAGF44_04390 [Pseudomonadota bacterium]
MSLALFLIFGSASLVSAASIITSGGQLVGARGVEVGSVSLDFDIVDGTCASVFNGCDEPGDFFFTDPTFAADAMFALRDQVFLDGPAGNFDSDPNLTLGCEVGSDDCGVFAPVAGASLGPDFVAAVGFLNRPDDQRDDRTAGAAPRFVNTDQLTWAVFSDASVAAVPLPSSLALLLGSLLFPLVLTRKRAVNQAA